MLDDLSAPDEEAAGAVLARAARTLRPAGALRKLDEVAGWLAEWQRTTRPAVSNAVAAVFVADHGVSVEAVSAYPPAVTASMLAALRAGVATASVVARGVGVRLVVEDVGVGRPTGNLRREPALDETRFERSVGSGSELVRAERSDLLVLGEMGIGNPPPAAAVCAGLFGGPAEDWTGRGSGIDDDAFDRKVSVVVEAAERVEGQPPLEILRQVGGAELAAVAGAVAEARRRRVPVVLDGFVVTAAAAALETARPGALRHCIAGHCSGEPGHRLLLEKLGKVPLLDLELRLGEASGALLAVPLIRLAAVALTGGLHEDGLGDPFDALGATSRADALRILSDPAHGTYGLLALVVGTTVRVFALGSLRPVTALGVLVAAHALARAAAVSVLLAMPAAKDHGLAVSHASGVSRRPAIATASVGIALAGVGMGPWALPAVALVAAGAALVGFAALRRFGGITGDVLGAVEQVGEVAVVVMGSGAARGGGVLGGRSCSFATAPRPGPSAAV